MLTTVVGIFSALVAGLLNGSFAAPMKKTVKWEWENTWLIWAVWALVIIPFAIAYLTVPQLFEVYQQTERSVLVRTFLLGAGWGLGAITFGIGLYSVGLSVGFSVIMGITAVAGALIPMLLRSPGDILTSGGIVILAGMLCTMAGVVFCGNAGSMKEKDLSKASSSANKRSSFKLGLIICMASGIFNSMLNLSFIAGEPIAQTAQHFLGNASLIHFRAGNPIWVLSLSGAFLTNLIYCGGRMLYKGTFRNYGHPQTAVYWLYAFIMGVLWMGGVALYGAGASSLGKVGSTVAWIILMAMTVFAGNVWGLICGEWRGASVKALRPMIVGLTFLMVSIILVSIGNYLL